MINNKLKNDIIAEMTLRRERNDNAKTRLTPNQQVHAILLLLIVATLFVIMLDHNNTAINNLINQ